MEKIAILLTCHNRKQKTIDCLISLYEVLDISKHKINFDIFLVDDGSTDGTSMEIASRYPDIYLIQGSGELYWASGMRLAWESAINKNQNYDSYLLLNDDVILLDNVLNDLLSTHQYCLDRFNKPGIYVSSTIDNSNSRLSYGGLLIKYHGIKFKTSRINPGDVPQLCSLTNANILLVTKEVVQSIGILDSKYRHQFADYDYSLTASKKGIPVLVCPGFGGICTDDHGKSWLSSDSTLEERIKYLKSPTGLAYKEHLYYLKKNFIFQFPYYFTMLWLKTMFPSLWDKFKRDSTAVHK